MILLVLHIDLRQSMSVLTEQTLITLNRGRNSCNILTSRLLFVLCFLFLGQLTIVQKFDIVVLLVINSILVNFEVCSCTISLIKSFLSSDDCPF